MHRKVSILSADACLNASPVVRGEQLVGGMFSEDEVIVESREAIRLIPQYLEERYDIKFHFATCVYNIEATTVHTNMGKFEADEIYICSGPEFEALYPEAHLNSGLTKCKLQMLRTVAQPESSIMGPALCSGLTLLHYDSFKTCTTLQKVVELNNAAYPEYIKYGIHLLVSQNQYLEMTIGDSHEYGLSPDPFNRAYINDLIMHYFNQFVKVPHLDMQQTWNGVYAKMKKGTELVVKPADGITVVNGLGGAGMTLSFGLLEEVVNGTYSAQ
jgi:FAD dependent oxidoreductase TIGR03364